MILSNFYICDRVYDFKITLQRIPWFSVHIIRWMAMI